MKLRLLLEQLIDFYICVREQRLKIDIFERSELMTNLEKEEFISRIKGLDDEEMELVADLIPIELCMKRLEKELDKLKSLENWVGSTSKLLEGK